MNDLKIVFKTMKMSGHDYFYAEATIGRKKYTWARRVQGHVGELERLKQEGTKALNKVLKIYERRTRTVTSEA
jgi:hypothetical protein